jgi:hypothetical protein
MSTYDYEAAHSRNSGSGIDDDPVEPRSDQMKPHTHDCVNIGHCGASWRCTAGPVSDGDRIVCCEAEYAAHGLLACEDCAAGRCRDCGAYPGQSHDVECVASVEATGIQ